MGSEFLPVGFSTNRSFLAKNPRIFCEIWPASAESRWTDCLVVKLDGRGRSGIHRGGDGHNPSRESQFLASLDVVFDNGGDWLRHRSGRGVAHNWLASRSSRIEYRSGPGKCEYEFADLGHGCRRRHQQFGDLASFPTISITGDRTLTLSATVELIGSDATHEQFRFGLLNSNGSSSTAGWLGYLAMNGTGTQAGDMWAKNPLGENLLRPLGRRYWGIRREPFPWERPLIRTGFFLCRHL